VKTVPQFNKRETDILSILNNQFCIKYEAPKDARETGFPSEHFDFISSTLTLCFIPKDDLVKIIDECFRILKKGGVMSVTIDYQDNWSYVDSNITGYNFLQFSETEWKKYNPSIHYQNRLRHNDYLEIFENTGFTLVKENYRAADESDLHKLSNLIIDSSFSNFSMYELGIKDGEIVVRKN
jgi:SAM-dependent methyltransferase